MKISLKWLCEHIDVQDFFCQPEELARLLTAAGLEVEEIEDKSTLFKNVVVGRVVTLEKHPNADRLTVCQVDAGEGQMRQIVCGAKNHKAGDKVVVTLPGAILPGHFEIKKSKIRDVESLGMLASESELGLKKESEGIFILPADAPVGKPFAEFAGLDDVVFNINVSPNRADCLSHLGLARELKCLLNRPLRVGDIQMTTSPEVNTKKTLTVQVQDPKLCPRYAGRVIAGVKVGPSPAWLKTRLESVGVNSVNNVVDITSFIMLDLGQPLHAFDLATLHGGQVNIAVAAHGEVFTTLAGTELKLNGDELTIRDAKGAVCIAGVIGGANSGVSDQTHNLFIESAQFAMDSVRKTARRHGLQTDSAYRFSRGTDVSGVMRALDQACARIQQVAGGTVASDHWDYFPNPALPRAIAVTAEYVAQRLGYPVSEAQLIDWLQRLDCQVEESAAGLRVTPPGFRVDLEQNVDLVEEYGRLNGYDHIPETLPVLSYAPLPVDKAFMFESRLSELARDAGLAQCVNFGFTNSREQASLLGPVENFRSCGLEMDPQAIAIQNPLSADFDVMRVSLLPGLVKNLLHNYRHGNGHGRLFELGHVFRKGPEGYLQDPRLGFVVWGVGQDLWHKQNGDQQIFFALKGQIQFILKQLGVQQVQFNPWLTNAPALLHPSQTSTVFAEGRNIGFFATLHPKWCADQKVRVPVAVAELDVKSLGRGQPRTVKFKSVSKFPAVERDLAFVMPRTMASAEVESEIRKTSGALLQSLEVFDLFAGPGLPEGHVSIAYRMIFQDIEGTLNEERLTALHSQIVSNVEKKLAIKVR